MLQILKECVFRLSAARFEALPWRRHPGLQLSRVVHLWYRRHFGGVSFNLISEYLSDELSVFYFCSFSQRVSCLHIFIPEWCKTWNMSSLEHSLACHPALHVASSSKDVPLTMYKKEAGELWGDQITVTQTSLLPWLHKYSAWSAPTEIKSLSVLRSGSCETQIHWLHHRETKTLKQI